MKNKTKKNHSRKYYIRRAVISFIASIVIFYLPMLISLKLLDKELNGYISLLSMLLAAGGIIFGIISLFRAGPRRKVLVEKEPSVQRRESGTEQKIPSLDTALESGPIGEGRSYRIQESAQEVRIVHDATDSVHYYYFSEGLLIFSGVGGSKAVDPGGYDGRTSYITEDIPWSEVVCNGTHCLIVTDGVRSIGSGLLQSLKNLEEINLADSVREIGTNDCRSVHTLRVGRGFQSCEMSSGPLRELVLPEHHIHIGWINSGAELKLRSDNPNIQAELIKNIKAEFAQTMVHAFPIPAVRLSLIRLGWADTDYALRQMALMKWNGRYGDRAVPEADLWKLLGLSPDIPMGTELEVTLSREHGVHSIIQLGAVILLVVRKQPSALSVHIASSMLLPNTDVLRAWWQKVAPQVELKLLKLPNDEVLVEVKASSSRYFEKVAQIQMDGWLQLDYLLISGYGYDTMLKCICEAVSLAKHVDKLWTARIIGDVEMDRTDAFFQANCDPYSCSATKIETGVISIAGVFEGLPAPAKIVLINQSHILRIFLLNGKTEDRPQVDAFVETLIDKCRQ